MAIWWILWTLVHRGAPPISRYTRVLRAAHRRVKSMRHLRFGSLIVHELWLMIHLLFSLVWCWFRSNLHLLNTQQASVSLRHWHTERLFFAGLSLGATAWSYRRQDGADAAARFREVFACSRLFATTDLSQIYNREARRHGTPCNKTTDSYLFSFLHNNPRKIRRETTVGKFVPNNGRR